MNVRDALMVQAPSLELHRAAQNEIFRLDGERQKDAVRIKTLRTQLDACCMAMDKARFALRAATTQQHQRLPATGAALTPYNLSLCNEAIDNICKTLERTDTTLDVLPDPKGDPQMQDRRDGKTTTITPPATLLDSHLNYTSGVLHGKPDDAPVASDLYAG